MYRDQTPADGMTDSPMDGSAAGQIILDKSNPDIAEAFAECQPGDTFKVVKDDENEVVLEKMDEAGEESDEMDDGTNGADQGASDDDMGGMKSDKPGVMALIMKKRKQ